MNDRDFLIEPERYEFNEGLAYVFEVNRRDFLRFGTAGLFVCLAARSASSQELPVSVRLPNQPVPTDVSGWIHIDERGGITAYTGKVEIGQNIRTSLAQAVADELSAPIGSITMVMGDTDVTPFDIGTFGSLTTPRLAPLLRRAAAAARQALLDLAAERWSVPADQLDVVAASVRHAATNRTAGFGELTRGQRIVEAIPADLPTNPPDRWTAAGTALHKVNGQDIVTGRTAYVSDTKRPDLLFGKVVRPPAQGATLLSVDDAAARKMPGVTVVRDGGFVGVVARKPWIAEEAAAAIQAKWTAPVGQPSSSTIFDFLKANAEKPAPRPAALEQALAGSRQKLDGRYTVAFIAPVPLEPRAAVAEWVGGRLTVWTGTQRPFLVREEVALAFRMPADQVHVIVPPFGSAYGGKHTGEQAVEAARLARAAGGPVKLVWTRAEEFQWGYLRPAGVIEIASGIDGDGLLTAWDFVNHHSGQAAIKSMYNVANQREQFVTLDPPLRSGSVRALAAVANNFAREVHIDELAGLARMDPLAFRLKNLADTRARAVLEAAAERFGWGRTPPKGRGMGVAFGFEKDGYVATCVELECAPGQGEPKIHRLVVSYDCGAIVNPDGLNNQIVGGVIQAIGGGVFEAIEFADGRILNGLMRRYRVPRFADVPPIDVVTIDRRDIPSAGAGETPIIAVAPAISNAIFAATGERRRSLPLAGQASRGSGSA